MVAPLLFRLNVLTGNNMTSKDQKDSANSQKKRIRNQKSIWRKDLSCEDLLHRSECAAAFFLKDVPYQDYKYVAGYWPLQGEIDPLPLLNALITQELQSSLPFIQSHKKELGFRKWQPGDPSVEAAYGTREPKDDAEICTPDLFIVPLLAFDRYGTRLGFGGGFYDRTLGGLEGRDRHLIVGLGHSEQEEVELPREAWDVFLDWIVTERETIRIVNESS